MYKKNNYLEEIDKISLTDSSFFKRLFYAQTKILSLSMFLQSRLRWGISLSCILFLCLFGKYAFLHDNLYYLKSFEIYGIEYNSVVLFLYLDILVDFVLTLSMVVNITIELWSVAKYFFIVFLIAVSFFLLYDSCKSEEIYYFRAKLISCCMVLICVSLKKIKYCYLNKIFYLPKLNTSYSEQVENCIFNTLFKENEDSFDELNKRVCDLFDLKRISSLYFYSICICTFIPVALIFIGYFSFLGKD